MSARLSRRAIALLTAIRANLDVEMNRNDQNLLSRIPLRKGQQHYAEMELIVSVSIAEGPARITVA